MMEEVAYIFHFQPSELAAMRMSQLIRWHAAGRRITRQARR